MTNYKITIQYDGSRYKGWQKLGDSDNTIQSKLEKILKTNYEKDIEVIGTSRTDAGVHALMQCANFKLENEVSIYDLQQLFNRYLPEDISVIRVEIVDDRFHARYNVVSKTYLYKIWNRSYSNPFIRKYSMHVEESLDMEKMIKAAEYLIGEHDFTAFSTASSKKKSMVRIIDSIEITRDEGIVYIRIKGKSFLYNMVRRIAGTLIEVGSGNIKPKKVEELLTSKIRKSTGLIAESKGLHLEKIEY